MPRVTEHIIIENAKITSRNFAGNEGPYNPQGVRSFSLILEKEIGLKLFNDGWNVKGSEFLNYANSVNSGASTPADWEAADIVGYLNVAVSFKNYPARIYTVTDGVINQLTEETVGLLDNAQIDNIDINVRPYNWLAKNGKDGGVKAYVEEMYVTLHVSSLYRKYHQNDIPDDMPGDEDLGLPFEL